MTRDEWAACADPGRMLEVDRGRATERKLRLFACALVRRCRWGDAQKTVLGIAGCAEGWLDGLATREEAIESAHRLAVEHRLAGAASEEEAGTRGLVTALLLLLDAPLAASAGLRGLGDHVGPAGCAGALRCLFGNPCRPATPGGRLASFFRGLIEALGGSPARPPRGYDRPPEPLPAVAPDPSWLTPTVVALARLAYDTGDFSVLPILADALQDAGCGNDDVLNHCRGPNEHVKGCWCLDMLLGKS